MKVIISILFATLFLYSCSPYITSNVSNLGSKDPGHDGQNDGGVIPGGSAFEKLKVKTNEYRARYSLLDAFAKLVDNRGDKYERLYGVRNFRAVLHGVYYRGGANNSYNTVDGIRSNSNPLPASGLKNLCEENFKESIYLYSTNYDSSPKTVTCTNYKNEKNTLNYEQISPLGYRNNEKFFEKVYQIIKGQKQGPIYGHCWNGWHASGYVAAILLKQFCGYTDSKAVDYWTKNTDGNSEGHDSIVKQVAAFKIVEKYKISAAEAQLICP